MCKDALNIVKKDLEPKQDKGIGYFITCPGKNVRKNIYTAKYVFSKSFDYLYDDLVGQTPFNNFANQKRNETYFKNLLNLNSTILGDKEVKIKTGVKSLIEFNKILYGLESLSQCEYALSSINFIEENFCTKSLDSQSYSMVAYLIGAIGILFISVGLNKASVLIDEDSKKVKNFNFFYFYK